ncbi:MAG: GEVED domain-containing protein [Gemmataceae bacterium]
MNRRNHDFTIPRAKRQARRSPRSRPRLEVLEDRTAPAVFLDFGDAPASYGTLTASHVATGPILGTLRDTEATALVSANARGDDTNNLADEDGVQITNLVGGTSATWTVNVSGGPAKLDAWVDFNANGVFDATERITPAAGLAVSTGPNNVSFSVPSIFIGGDAFARFRLSTAGGLDPTGAATDGEIEDYRITVYQNSEIAFISSANFGGSDLYIMNPDGSNQRRTNTMPDAFPVWSPDGSRIAFLSGGSVYVCDEFGSNLLRLTTSTSDSNEVWSPDGKKIAFTRSSGPASDIYVVNANGSGNNSGLTQLTSASGLNTGAQWSPDGTKIVFLSNRDHLPNGGSEVYVMNANGSGQTRLTTTSATLQNGAPSWSRDGTKIVFDQERVSGGERDIWVMNANGSGLTKLTDSLADYRSPVYSPDGFQIAAWARYGVNVDVFVMNANGSNPQRLTTTDGADTFGSWSPDSQKIVFTSERDFVGQFNHEPEIYVMNRDGSNVSRLTINGGSDFDGEPNWGGIIAPPFLDTLYVDDNFPNPVIGEDPDGPGPAHRFGIDAFATIQEAVAAAPPGCDIIVNPGHYSGPVVFNKLLKIDGTDAATTILSGSGAGVGITLDNNGALGGIILSRMTVTNFGNGLSASNADILFLNDMHFTGNRAASIIANVTKLDVGLSDGADSFTINGVEFHRGGDDAMVYQGITKLSLLARGGNNTINVEGLHPGTPFAVFGGDGDDTFQVTAPTGRLGLLLNSQLSLDGGGGHNLLNVDEGRSDAGDVITVTPDHVLGEGAFPFSIDYSNSTGSGGDFTVNVLTGWSDDWVRVRGTKGAAGVATLGGNDVIDVTAQTGQLGAALGGRLNIDAGSGANYLNVSETKSNVGDVITIGADRMVGTGPRPFSIYFWATGGNYGYGVNLTTGVNDDWIKVQAQPTNSPLAVRTSPLDSYTGPWRDVVSVSVANSSGYGASPTWFYVDGGADPNAWLQILDVSGGGTLLDLPTGPNSGRAVMTYPLNATSLTSAIDYLHARLG